MGGGGGGSRSGGGDGRELKEKNKWFQEEGGEFLRGQNTRLLPMKGGTGHGEMKRLKRASKNGGRRGGERGKKRQFRFGGGTINPPKTTCQQKGENPTEKKGFLVGRLGEGVLKVRMIRYPKCLKKIGTPKPLEGVYGRGLIMSWGGEDNAGLAEGKRKKKKKRR